MAWKKLIQKQLNARKICSDEQDINNIILMLAKSLKNIKSAFIICFEFNFILIKVS